LRTELATERLRSGAPEQSGFAREGVRYAIEEMTELKLLALNERD
jgi:hypothetical protein